MNRLKINSAKILLKMAECDRKILTVTAVINSIIFVSMSLKLITSIFCAFCAFKKK